MKEERLENNYSVEVFEMFFRLYRLGREHEKAPTGYIDYFKARHFLLEEINKAYNSGIEKGKEQGTGLTIKVSKI